MPLTQACMRWHTTGQLWRQILPVPAWASALSAAGGSCGSGCEAIAPGREGWHAGMRWCLALQWGSGGSTRRNGSTQNLVWAGTWPPSANTGFAQHAASNFTQQQLTTHLACLPLPAAALPGTDQRHFIAAGSWKVGFRVFRV
jgi:hypothetical protein